MFVNFNIIFHRHAHKSHNLPLNPSIAHMWVTPNITITHSGQYAVFDQSTLPGMVLDLGFGLF